MEYTFPSVGWQDLGGGMGAEADMQNSMDRINWSEWIGGENEILLSANLSKSVCFGNFLSVCCEFQCDL